MFYTVHFYCAVLYPFLFGYILTVWPEFTFLFTKIDVKRVYASHFIPWKHAISQFERRKLYCFHCAGKIKLEGKQNEWEFNLPIESKNYDSVLWVQNTFLTLRISLSLAELKDGPKCEMLLRWLSEPTLVIGQVCKWKLGYRGKVSPNHSLMTWWCGFY